MTYKSLQRKSRNSLHHKMMTMLANLAFELKKAQSVTAGLSIRAGSQPKPPASL